MERKTVILNSFIDAWIAAMPKPRSAQISLSDTPYYHCISRCVRRAFLCGKDTHTQQSYEHRKDWVETRLLELADIFAIDVSAYAVMSNHTHIVLHIDKAIAEAWTADEVLERWHKLYKGTLLTQQYANPSQRKSMTAAMQQAVLQTVECYRKRLYDVSWFMRSLNEFIARKANQEDNCTGRFWEGRFKCQALLDEAALAACLAYVDLNPIRAGVAKTPESSEHTSIQMRIRAALTGEQPKALMPFAGNPRSNMPKGLPFELKDYMALVDLTGRAMREDKRGYIESHRSPILDRLAIDDAIWLELTHSFEKRFGSAVGREIIERRLTASPPGFLSTA